MPKKLGSETLEQALKLLAEKLGFDRAEPAWLAGPRRMWTFWL